MSDRFSEHLSERDRAANPYASTRIWNDNHDRIGLVGEKILCAHFGAVQDLRNKPGGDGGVDLEIFVATKVRDGWLKLNVRGTEVKNPRLIINCDKTRRDVCYVLAQITSLELGTGYCRGWLSGAALIAMEPAMIRGEPAYATRALWPMSPLDDCFVTWRHSEER